MIDLLRRLTDRFEQVIVITHIEDVGLGVDHRLLVRFDDTIGTTVVTAVPAMDANEQLAAVA